MLKQNLKRMQSWNTKNDNKINVYMHKQREQFHITIILKSNK